MGNSRKLTDVKPCLFAQDNISLKTAATRIKR